jgi:hypothetical protein
MFSFLKIKKRKYLHPMAYMKEAQAKGEAFSPQKRSSTSNQEIYPLLLFWWLILPSLIRIQPTNINRVHAN